MVSPRGARPLAKPAAVPFAGLESFFPGCLASINFLIWGVGHVVAVLGTFVLAVRDSEHVDISICTTQ